MKKNIYMWYSTKDKFHLENLIENINYEGFNIISNDEKPMVDSYYMSKFLQKLSNSDYFIIVISKHSIKSKMIENELGEILKSENKEMPEILIINIDGSKIPTFLSKNKTINYLANNFIKITLNTLKKTEFEKEMKYYNLSKSESLKLVHLCLLIGINVKAALLAIYKRSRSSKKLKPFTAVPPIRILLFTVHEKYKCLRQQVCITDLRNIDQCKNMFTYDQKIKKHLIPPAIAWKNKKIHTVNYTVEFNQNSEQYIKEAIKHGFNREDMVKIKFYVASSISVAISECFISERHKMTPVVICIDSERSNVFPKSRYSFLKDLIENTIIEHNSFLPNPLQCTENQLIDDTDVIINQCFD